MQSSRWVRSATALAVVSLFAGCATWSGMDRSEKGTAVGATGGAVVGAAVGGPVGAAVGAGVGGYAGHRQASAPNDTRTAASGERSRTTNDMRADASTTRSAPGVANTPVAPSGPADAASPSSAKSSEFGISAPATSRAYGTGPDGMRTAQERANAAEGVASPSASGTTSSNVANAPSPAAAGSARTNGNATGGADRASSRTAAARSGATDNRMASASRSSTRSGATSAAAAGRGAGAAMGHGHDAGTVRQVQQALSQRGFDPGPVDGIWGPRTEGALRQFQQAQGMAASGALDAPTMSALNGQGGAATATSSSGATGANATSPAADNAGAIGTAAPAGPGGATGSPAR